MSGPAHIAVIGSGPSGFYAADALLKADREIHVDLFDRLPTPFGLVRGGVAPDHPSIKGVVKVYEKTAAHPRFRFFGNVVLGRDLTVEDLAAHYDAWVYAVGSEADRSLGIPGEALTGSHSATALVGWYNAHPDHAHHRFDLGVERAAVVGVGNVAMDVARVLASHPDRLSPTDISANALAALRESRLREIWVLGRRGPAQAAFSPPEIQELSKLEGVDLVVRPEELEIDPEVCAADLTDVNVQKNLAFLREVAERGEGTQPRKIRLRFHASPVEVLGADGRVSGLRIGHNRLVERGGSVIAEPSGAEEVLPVGLVFRSVGYRGVPIAGVPFDARSGIIPNVGGRVVDPETRAPLRRQYVVGWAKRGPSGLIGTNRRDSQDTVAELLADLPADPPQRDPQAIVGLLEARDVRYTSYAEWQRLDAHEVAQGTAAGKVREKVVSIEEMVTLAKGTPARC